MALAETSQCPATNKYVVEENGNRVAKAAVSPHSSGCLIVKQVEVTFTHTDLPSPTPETSGRVFAGQLKYYWETFDTNGVKTDESNAVVNISSGGFFDSEQLDKGDGTSCDTCYPRAATAGESPYNLPTVPAIVLPPHYNWLVG